jgi:hypothetical protein
MNSRKNGSPWFWSILIGLFLVLVPELCFAKDSRSVFTQGLVNPGGNLKAGYLLINEMRVYLDASTSITDQGGNLIPATEVKPKKWVYLEMEKGPDNRMRARKIYLLPRYINPEEKRKFAFMK